MDTMKISRLMQLVCVNVFIAGPALASLPVVSEPIPLCGEKAESSEKAEKSEKADTVVKSEKKNDKKDDKDKKTASKDSA
jgi:hypothetical protein